VWFLALKDLKIFATDRAALFFGILFPFMFVILFNFLLKDVGSEDVRLELVLATREAEGGLSHQIIGAMETKDESLLKPGEPKIIWLKDYGEARRQVEEKELAGFLAFPEDFTRKLNTGQGAELEVVVNPERTYNRAALHGLAQAISTQIGAQYASISATMELLTEHARATGSAMPNIGGIIQQSLAGEAGSAARQSYITYETEKVGEVEAEEPANYVIPGYLVMFVFFTAALSAERIVRERQRHTLERLLSTQVRREAVLGGIFVGTALKGLVQIAIFWAAGLLIFRIDLGLAPAAVIIISILVILMSSAFGLMLATLVKTDRAAGSIGVLTSLILAPLGGCWWPLFITPKWMQFIAKFTPHGWAITGFNKVMLFGAGFGSVVPEMLVLIGFGVLFGLISIWRFRTSAV
jgi:ABC-2 type transport system permease protein